MRNVAILLVAASTVLLAGAVMWYMWPASSVTDEGNSLGYGVASGQVTVPVAPGFDVGSGLTSPTLTPQLPASSSLAISLEAEFNKLFTALEAERIALLQVGSSSGDLGIVYTIYAAEIAESKELSPETPQILHATLQDLDGDGTDELVVYNDLPEFCGSGGCPLQVLKRVEGVWRLVLDSLAASTIGLLDGGTSFNSLLVTTDDVEGIGKVERYVWDGSVYRPFGVVAIWDGQTFVLTQ